MTDFRTPPYSSAVNPGGTQLSQMSAVEPPVQTGKIPLPRLADFSYGDRSVRISPELIVSLTRLGELLGIAGVGIVIFAAYVGLAELSLTVLYVVSAFFVASVAVLTFEIMQLYQISVFKTLFHQLSRMAAAWTLVFAMVLAVMFFAKIGDQYSRVWLGLWYLAGLGALLGGRVYLSYLIRWWARRGQLVRRAVVIGGGREGAELIEALEASNSTDIRIAGVFDDRDDDRSPAVVSGYPKLGTVAELVEFARKTRVDILLVTGFAGELSCSPWFWLLCSSPRSATSIRASGSVFGISPGSGHYWAGAFISLISFAGGRGAGNWCAVRW